MPNAAEDERLADAVVAVAAVRVDVLADRPREQKVVPQNDVDVRPQFLKTHFCDVSAVDLYLSRRTLQNPQHCEHQRTLPASRATHDSYVFARSDLQTHSAEHIAEFRVVATRILLECDLALRKQFPIEGQILELVSLNEVILQEIDVPFFGLQFSQLLAFSNLL